MSEIVAMIQHMRAKGIACSVILEAVEALSNAKEEAIEERRANDRVRKARSRAAQREALKSQEMCHVTPADSTDSADQKTSPPVSPLFPSPTPLTNNPPITPPTSQISETREPKSKRAKGSRLPADWVLPADFIEWARDYRDPAFPEKQLTDEEIAREGHSIADWSANSANGAKADWFAAWRNWIRRAAPTILRARPRANGSAGNGIPSASRRPNAAPQSAPYVSLFDALGVVGAEASGVGGNAGWEPDHGNGSGEAQRPPLVEIIDFGDPRGIGARRSEADRSGTGAALFALPAAAVR